MVDIRRTLTAQQYGINDSNYYEATNTNNHRTQFSCFMLVDRDRVHTKCEKRSWSATPAPFGHKVNSPQTSMGARVK